jgi:RNA polymerase sigma factor (TIGR02999 family)
MRGDLELDITGMLRELTRGTPGALDRLIPAVYATLRRIAHAELRGEREGHTLSSTALVHEAYLRLVNLGSVTWQDRAHFFAVAARVMRRILIDYARARRRDKRGGTSVRVPLSEAEGLGIGQAEDLIDLDQALTRLEAQNERLCRVVECRCIAGLSVEETAEALGTSPATVKRDWAFARAWLNRVLGDEAGEHGDGEPVARSR